MPERHVYRKHRYAIQLNSVPTRKDHGYIVSEAEPQTVGNCKIETALYLTQAREKSFIVQDVFARVKG
jgi:hypothetical protein